MRAPAEARAARGPCALITHRERRRLGLKTLLCGRASRFFERPLREYGAVKSGGGICDARRGEIGIEPGTMGYRAALRPPPVCRLPGRLQRHGRLERPARPASGRLAGCPSQGPSAPRSASVLLLLLPIRVGLGSQVAASAASESAVAVGPALRVRRETRVGPSRPAPSEVGTDRLGQAGFGPDRVAHGPTQSFRVGRLHRLTRT